MYNRGGNSRGDGGQRAPRHPTGGPPKLRLVEGKPGVSVRGGRGGANGFLS